jgi:hypothetical protein
MGAFIVVEVVVVVVLAAVVETDKVLPTGVVVVGVLFTTLILELLFMLGGLSLGCIGCG